MPDNVAMERFFSLPKTERGARKSAARERKAKVYVFDSIQYFYNRTGVTRLGDTSAQMEAGCSLTLAYPGICQTRSRPPTLARPH